ncbi:MAG: serine/threonine-protein kinase [Planctomycetota bacterium]
MSDDELIDGTYKLIMCIATGGSSQVWECVEQATGRHLAMKLLKEESPDFKENKAGLKHEADVLKTLDHPLIIKFDRFSSSRDNTYMTMEHFRAANVKLQLKSDIRSVHVRTRILFESVCQALSHVHSRGWIHRDIKPDNVLMNKVGEIRLVDYSLSSKEVTGFSKMIGGGKLKTIQGTRTYIAPETIRKQAPTFQTDLYSLGIMFFEVLTGRTPFQAPTPEELLKRHLRDEPANASEFNKNVTPEMDRIIYRLLKKKPTDRPGTVDEVLAELKRIRIFKEDVTDVSQKEIDDKDASMENLTELRLDSRADAKLSQMLQSNPELARQFAQEKAVKSTAKKAAAAKVADRAQSYKDTQTAKKAGAAPPPAAAPPQMMPMPMMPQAYPPGYAPFPQQPFGMPQQMPPQMPPGMVPPGMPGYPMSGQQMPGMPGSQMMPGQMPMQPVPAQPGFVPGQGMPPGGMPEYPPQPPGPGPTPVSARPAIPPQPGVVAQTAIPTPAAQRAAPPPVSAAQPTVPARPAAPAPVAARPAPAQPARPATPPQTPKPAPAPISADELEFMTELPDVL